MKPILPKASVKSAGLPQTLFSRGTTFIINPPNSQSPLSSQEAVESFIFIPHLGEQDGTLASAVTSFVSTSTTSNYSVPILPSSSTLIPVAKTKEQKKHYRHVSRGTQNRKSSRSKNENSGEDKSVQVLASSKKAQRNVKFPGSLLKSILPKLPQNEEPQALLILPTPPHSVIQATHKPSIGIKHLVSSDSTQVSNKCLLTEKKKLKALKKTKNTSQSLKAPLVSCDLDVNPYISPLTSFSEEKRSSKILSAQQTVKYLSRKQICNSPVTSRDSCILLTELDVPHQSTCHSLPPPYTQVASNKDSNVNLQYIKPVKRDDQKSEATLSLTFHKSKVNSNVRTASIHSSVTLHDSRLSNGNTSTPTQNGQISSMYVPIMQNESLSTTSIKSHTHINDPPIYTIASSSPALSSSPSSAFYTSSANEKHNSKLASSALLVNTSSQSAPDSSKALNLLQVPASPSYTQPPVEYQTSSLSSHATESMSSVFPSGCSASSVMSVTTSDSHQESCLPETSSYLIQHSNSTLATCQSDFSATSQQTLLQPSSFYRLLPLSPVYTQSEADFHEHSRPSTSYDSPHPAFSNQSPQPPFYNQSPLSVAQPSVTQPSVSYDYAESPQPVSYSAPLLHSSKNNYHQSHQINSSVERHGSLVCFASESVSYRMSPDTVVTSGPASFDDYSNHSIYHPSHLPPYSFTPQESSSMQHLYNANSDAQSDMYCCENKSFTPEPPYAVVKSQSAASHSFCSSEAGCSKFFERSLSPPSYEAHINNSPSSSLIHPSSSGISYYMHSSELQSVPTNYSQSSHSPRPPDSYVSDVNLREGHKSPPAYSSLSLPPPTYSSRSQVASLDDNSAYVSSSYVMSKWESSSDYPTTPYMSNRSDEYSVESSGPCVNNTSQMSSEGSTPMKMQGMTPHCSSVNLSANFSALSLPAFSGPSTYPPLQNTQQYSNHEEQKTRIHVHKSFDEEQAVDKHYTDSADTVIPEWQNTTKRSGTPVNENLRFWFIPHQEQEEAYTKRKELAKNYLKDSDKWSDRDRLLKEKFWIEEDEPIGEDIVVPVATEDLPKDELQQQLEIDDDMSSRSLHQNDENASKPQEYKKSIKQNKKKVLKLLCQICGMMLKGRSSLKSHLNSHTNIHPHVCLYCSKSFTSRSILVNHHRIHTGEMPYTCSVCDKKFRIRSGFERHKSMHTNVRPYKCSSCSKSFKTKSVLQQHRKVHGTRRCPHCGETFEKLKSLTAHKASAHKSTQTFLCPHCPNVYNLHSLLTQHLQIHSSVRKYICSKCDQSFVWRSGLAAHMKTHSILRLVCDICGLQFASKKRLDSHYRSHRQPQQSEKCGQTFPRSFQVDSHKLDHKTLKVHICSKCDLVLTSAKKLKKHKDKDNCQKEKTHTITETGEIAKSKL